MRRRLWLAYFGLALGTWALQANAGDEVLVLEQDYNLVEQAADGFNAKDIRQKVYIHKDFMCIDEYGSHGANQAPTESIAIDFKNKLIINLDHEFKKKVTETFDARRKRLDVSQAEHADDLARQPAGPQRDKLAKLFRAMLDDKRHFEMLKDSAPPKTLAGISCRSAKVFDADAPNYVPLDASLHPELELPYDNVEVLYLLKIIGKQMAKFLSEHRDVFKFVPMELHLDLAAGGKLDTKVISVEKVERATLASPALRGNLGNPFEVPAYEEKMRRPMPKPQTKKDGPD